MTIFISLKKIIKKFYVQFSCGFSDNELSCSMNIFKVRKEDKEYQPKPAMESYRFDILSFVNPITKPNTEHPMTPDECLDKEPK